MTGMMDNEPEVSRIGRIAGFMNGIDEGVFPLRWDITSSEARVNQVEQYGADHGQTHFNNTDTYAIDPTGRGTGHAQNDTV